MQKDLTTDEVQEALKKLAIFVDDAKKQWDAQNPNPKSWFGINSGALLKATTFLISVTDELIQYVETIIEKGPDKRAAVILTMGQLFDYVMQSFAPLWLKPMLPVIKQIVVTIVIGNLIEFIVAKYKAGYWKMEHKDEPVSQPVSTNQ